jgi:UDP-N-acetylmuramate dehydrogenase
LDFEFTVFDEALDFFAVFCGDAFAHFDDLFDFVAADFLHVADIEEADIDTAFGEFGAQDVVDLHELEISVADEGDFFLFFFEFDGGAGSFEIEAGADLFGGVVHRVFHFNDVGFADGIKTGHGALTVAMFLRCDNCGMSCLKNIEKNVPLQAYNSFGIVAKAYQLLRIPSAEDLQVAAREGGFAKEPPFILGGGCNIVLTGDVKPLVLKMEIMGKRLVSETAKHFIVEAGAGENWHEFVAWTVAQGWPGLENLALIPGNVGAAPVQNIGAYGVELQDRFHSLDAVNLHTGELFTLEAAQCAFGYRDSVFKHATQTGLLGKAVITAVRFALPKAWRPELGYADLLRKYEEFLGKNSSSPRNLLHTLLSKGEQIHWPDIPSDQIPSAQTILDWVVQIRRAKLPDPAVIGNAGSFFKNPFVSADQCADIIAREPKVVHYTMADGSIKLAAGWLIDACGWKGKGVGNAGVYEKQALVLVNKGSGTATPATGGEVMTLARAIQTSVYERFGILLEPEPVVV